MAEDSPGTLEAIAIEIAKVFSPMRERIDAGEIILLLAELGIKFPDALATQPAFQSAVTDVATNIGKLPPLIGDMIQAFKDEDYSTAGEKTLDLLAIITEMAEDFQTIGNAIDAGKPYAGISNGDLTTFLGNFAENLVDYLVVNYIQTAVPEFAVFLEFFGIIEETVMNPGSVNPLLPEYTKKDLRLDRIGKLLDNPAELMYDLYDWGNDATFTGDKLLQKLEKVLTTIGWPAVYESTPSPSLDILFGTIEPRTAISPKGIAVVISEVITAGYTVSLNQDKWTFDVGIEAGLPVSAAAVIQPNGKMKLEGSISPLTGKAFIKWTAKDNVDNLPLLLIGTREGSRLQTDEISAKLQIDFVIDGGGPDVSGTVTVEAEIKKGKIVIKPGNPDGFLAKILPPEGFSIEFDLLMGVNSDSGFYMKGSGTLEFDIPASISIGPISILNLTVGITPGSTFVINLGADIKAELGPFTAIVENMGMKNTLTFPSDRKGNLGPVNLDIGFKPPNGIALTLDAGAVKGGGYLMLDYEKGEYAGAIELEFKGLFGFSAIGLINTKFPDGSKGFSLLLLVNVTFGTPIALGFNFYLAGVGGIIGLHRSMNTEAIRLGVKDGSISNILFPENVIANITKIISDIKAIFPIKQDQFVLGLMARITWNTPAVLTIEAGLAIEFPNPVKIAIIGVIRCQLPNPEKAVLQLNVAFAGIIDFEKKLLSFDASIFNSRILTITLEGDIALRISWGDKPDFLVSVGGFHPAYTPPAHLELLPMKRLTVNILSGNPNLVLTAYFALTSNTIQFGAALDFSFRISKFGIYGYLGFDVLIQFSPFRFIAGITASVEVRWGSTVLFSIGLSFNLEGPAPWRAHGYAKFKILFISFKVKFDKTWGEKKENSLPSTSVLPLLLEQLQKNENWDTKENATLTEQVELAKDVEDDTAVIVKPFGSLEVDQTVVPLDLTMEKFGNYQPDDIKKAKITSMIIGGDTFTGSQTKDLKNSFAPAAYKKMKDEDKLSSPSYENQNSGLRVTTTDDRKWDYGINRLVEYETIISDYEEEKLPTRKQFRKSFFRPFVNGGDIGKSPMSRLMKEDMVQIDKKVNFLADEQYAVVSSKTMKNAHASSLVFNTKSEADEYLRDTIAADPSREGKIQLSPAFAVAP